MQGILAMHCIVPALLLNPWIEVNLSVTWEAWKMDKDSCVEI